MTGAPARRDTGGIGAAFPPMPCRAAHVAASAPLRRAHRSAKLLRMKRAQQSDGQMRRVWVAALVTLSLVLSWIGATARPGAAPALGPAQIVAALSLDDTATLSPATKSQRPVEQRADGDPVADLTPAGLALVAPSPAGTRRAQAAAVLPAAHQPLRPGPRAPPLA